MSNPTIFYFISFDTLLHPPRHNHTSTNGAIKGRKRYRDINEAIPVPKKVLFLSL